MTLLQMHDISAVSDGLQPRSEVTVNVSVA
jgi:hypothetical protein